jgi:PAS domain S-box-containing protein
MVTDMHRMAATPRRQHIHILHVDDDPDITELTETLLEHENDRFTVETAHSADVGMEKINDHRPDCVVSDYNMPGRNGLEFLQAVREEYPDLPFILFTGKGSETVASDAISAGVTDYLQKGSDTSQYTVLANRIRNAVEKARTETIQQRQVHAIETAREGIAFLNEDFEFIDVNDAYADLFGYSPSELVSESWRLLYPEDNVSQAKNDVSPNLQAEGYWRGETTLQRATGETFVADHVISATEGSEYVCLARDVTEHKERQRKLARYKTFVEATGDPMYALDADGQLTFVNEAFIELTGYDRDSLTGSHPSVFTSEATITREESVIRSLLSSEADREIFEFSVHTAEGDRVPCECHVALLPFDDEFRGTVAVLRDITERQEREARLKEEHQRFETLFTQLTQPLVEVEYDGLDPIVTDVNPAFEDTFGYTATTIVGESLDDYIVPESEETEAKEINEHVREGGRLVSREVTRQTAEGPREFLLENAVYEDGSGGFAIYTDITDRKRREQELQRQNERLDQFASVVSHDLRNPLNVASARLELATEECESPHLEHVAGAHDRMGQLIEDLLTFARAGTETIDHRSVTLPRLIEECWESVGSADARLVCETERTVQADRDRLRQLLENLCANALEHGGTDVTVRVGECAGGFYVEDTGPGIAEDERETVFEAGYSSDPEGTGFGLSIVEQVAEAHDWDIRLTDGSTGGTRFEITDVDIVE